MTAKRQVVLEPEQIAVEAFRIQARKSLLIAAEPVLFMEYQSGDLSLEFQ